MLLTAPDALPTHTMLYRPARYYYCLCINLGLHGLLAGGMDLEEKTRIVAAISRFDSMLGFGIQEKYE